MESVVTTRPRYFHDLIDTSENTSLTIVLNLWCVLKKVIANKLLNTNRLSLGQLLDESDWIQVSPTETHHHSSALMCTLPVVQFRSLIWIWHTKIRLSNAKVNYFCVCLHQTGSVQTRLASTDIFDMIPFSPESPITKRVNCNGISSPKERGESHINVHVFETRTENFISRSLSFKSF